MFVHTIIVALYGHIACGALFQNKKSVQRPPPKTSSIYVCDTTFFTFPYNNSCCQVGQTSQNDGDHLQRGGRGKKKSEKNKTQPTGERANQTVFCCLSLGNTETDSQCHRNAKYLSFSPRTENDASVALDPTTGYWYQPPPPPPPAPRRKILYHHKNTQRKQRAKGG